MAAKKPQPCEMCADGIATRKRHGFALCRDCAALDD